MTSLDDLSHQDPRYRFKKPQQKSGKFTMRNFIAAAIFTVFSVSANAVVLTFDDVPGGSIQDAYGHAENYKGFHFSSNLDWIDTNGYPPWNYGAHSGDFTLLNNTLETGDSAVGIITEGTGQDFVFNGLWAKKWATTPDSGSTFPPLNGFLAGYKDGDLQWIVSTVLDGSFRFFGPQLAEIDALHLGFGNNFLVDDIDLVVTTVPAPAAVWLFGSALAGLGWIRQRQVV